MYYLDQLVATGQLNDVGSPLRQNVDRSFRRGIEIQGGVILTKQLTWNVNLTLSQNKIIEFDEIIEDYTIDYDIISINQKNSDIALSPNIISSSEISYEPKKGFEVALLTRYVGEQFLDNTSNDNRKLDAYLVNDLRLQAVIPQKFFKEMKIQLLVNNILSEEYSSNGYTYTYVVGESITENFYYPQALRNYMIGLNLKF
jgi:iron complex outermembrane receptor protein